MAEGGIADARDLPLQRALAAGLNVAELNMKGLKGISGQQYISQFLQALQPLALMYESICKYTQRTNTKTSNNTRSIEWDFKVGNVHIKINLEHFRRYEVLLRDLPDQEVIHSYMGRFTQVVLDVTKNDRDPLGHLDSIQLDSIQLDSASRPEALAIHALGQKNFTLTEEHRNTVYPFANELPLLLWRLQNTSGASSHPKFADLYPPMGWLRH